MATGRLNLVVLEVADVDRSCTLYTDAFGLDLHVDDHEGAEQGDGDRWISGRHAACTWKDGASMHFALYEAKADEPEPRRSPLPGQRSPVRRNLELSRRKFTENSGAFNGEPASNGGCGSYSMPS